MLTQVTSEKAVKAAFLDVMSAYITPALGGWTPEEREEEEDPTDEEALRDEAVLALTYARLLFADVARYAYATAKASKDNTTAVTSDDIRRSVASYRRLGLDKLVKLRELLEMKPCLPRYVAILGETI